MPALQVKPRTNGEITLQEDTIRKFKQSLREVGYVPNIAASWEKAEDDKTNIDWARAAGRDMRSFSTGGTYVNFLTEEEGDEPIQAAYGNNYDRLVEVKSKWDPGNLFCTNKNIAPTG